MVCSTYVNDSHHHDKQQRSLGPILVNWTVMHLGHGERAGPGPGHTRCHVHCFPHAPGNQDEQGFQNHGLREAPC